MILNQSIVVDISCIFSFGKGKRRFGGLARLELIFWKLHLTNAFLCFERKLSFPWIFLCNPCKQIHIHVDIHIHKQKGLSIVTVEISFHVESKLPINCLCRLFMQYVKIMHNVLQVNSVCYIVVDICVEIFQIIANFCMVNLYSYRALVNQPSRQFLPLVTEE